ncbi:hypothetical protein [Bradyrhizobium sp. URHD0069]|uniref:hypothetical protein n=1 Tax=Bradyrhizobium sp. URHD0069 TaxID=1380355 RepID=UPI00049538A0|nr:hypothetical protein [Bradyrhizobium sp. URHD0069]
MTRDEAVKKAEECFTFNHPSQEWFFTPLRLVAALENLGVLKPDEPKSAQQMAYAALIEGRWTTAGAAEAIALIDKAGLKIVEK